MSRFDHPAESAESRRRREQSAADLRAANQWLAAEVASLKASEAAARRDQALTLLVWTLCAFFWVCIAVLIAEAVR